MHTIKIQDTVDKVKVPAEYDEQGLETSPAVMKSEEEVQAEKDVLIADKRAEVQSKVDLYEAAKMNQLENGGAGPVASFETMKICNEHSGEFEVIVE